MLDRRLTLMPVLELDRFAKALTTVDVCELAVPALLTS